jgi:membrane protein DedA with SNARE-associated domain
LFYVANLDYSWLAKFLSLLVLPLAHEDLAILLGGYMVVNKLMPVGLVAIAIYGGMVASDVSLYAIGAGARHIPWLNRLAVTGCVMSFGGALQRNLFGLAALSRVVPGVVFVVMIASGWTRVPFSRVALASSLTCALYLPLMLYLIVVFGDALDDRAGIWTWPFLLGVVAAAAFMRYRVFTFTEKPDSAGASTAQLPRRQRPASVGRGAQPVRMPELVNLSLSPRATRWIKLR